MHQFAMKSFLFIVALNLNLVSSISLDDNRIFRIFRMTGGRNATSDQFPYQVSIKLRGQHVCGGSIIHEKFVLTAAHCFFNTDCSFRGNDIKVLAGLSNLDSPTEFNITAEVEKLFVPKIFFEKHWYLRGDIAVLRLKKALDFRFGSPVRRLYRPYHKSYEDQRAIVTGYGWNWVKLYKDETGHLKRYGGSNKSLRYAVTRVLNNNQCSRLWKKHVPGSIICAQVIQENPAKPEGICAGDSGGPLVIDGVIIGVVSMTPKECKEHILPAIFTRVSSHSNFIDKALKDKNDENIFSIRFV